MRGHTHRVIRVLFLLVILLPRSSFVALAQEPQEIQPLQYKSRISFSPRTQTVMTDSEFEVSIYFDTLGFNINTLDLKISFPANLLSVVRPSSGESVIDVWVAPPKYSNSRGTIELSGIIPGGIRAGNGLVEKITFRAHTPGTAVITIQNTSKVLVNDGFGTEAEIETLPLKITIEPKAPDGLVVISNTHPYQGDWYNNKNPVFSWDPRFPNEVYSYELNDKPFTIPDDEPEGLDTVIGYENIKDGVWYFHIKSKVGRIWSNTTHYMARIDSTPPAQFTPEVNLLTGAASAPGIVTFFTTDALSGIRRYEVGVLDALSEPDTLPAFRQSESPYFLPNQISSNVFITVRAIDNAGNVRDTTISVRIPPYLLILANSYSSEIMLTISALTLAIGLWMITHAKRKRRLRDIIHPDDLHLLEYIDKNRYRLGAGGEIGPREEKLSSGMRIANTPSREL